MNTAKIETNAGNVLDVLWQMDGNLDDLTDEIERMVSSLDPSDPSTLDDLDNVLDEVDDFLGYLDNYRVDAETALIPLRDSVQELRDDLDEDGA